MIATVERLKSRDIKKLIPDFHPAVERLGESAESGGLEPALLELVNLRCSQINGCAYCVQYHITNGQSLGIPVEKMNLVVVWPEAGIFSEREQAALAWAEAVTRIAETHVPDHVYEATTRVFSDLELASLTAAICTINVWNRLSVSYRFPPEI